MSSPAAGGELRLAPTVWPALDTIHPELKFYDHWVVWRYELRNGKPTKVPYNALEGYQASSTDSRTWTGFDRAVAKYVNNSYAGVGFVLSSGDPFTVIDLDDCRNPESGELSELARKLVEHFASYTEV